MKLQILQQIFKKGLGAIERISSKSLTLPILNNVLIEAEKSFLSLSATDLEIGVRWWFLTKIEKEGKITIPSKLLSSFINSLPNKIVEISSSKTDVLNVDCDGYNTKIKGFSADEFPIIPKVGKDEFIQVKSGDFCRDLAQIVDIPLISTARPEISGIYFSAQKNLILAAATDSFRLGEKKISLNGKHSLSKNYSLIIPQKTIREVINIFGDNEGMMNIYFSPNQIMFESLMEETDHPQAQLTSRLIDGEYPNYKDIIPKDSSTQASFNKDEFLSQLRTAALFSGKNNEIKLKISPSQKKSEVFSQSSELGEHRSIIPGDLKGENVEAVFNYRFLMDGVSKAKGNEVILGLNGDSGPVVIRSTGDESYTYVAMPIKSS